MVDWAPKLQELLDLEINQINCSTKCSSKPQLLHYASKFEIVHMLCAQPCCEQAGHGCHRAELLSINDKAGAFVNIYGQSTSTVQNLHKDRKSSPFLLRRSLGLSSSESNSGSPCNSLPRSRPLEVLNLITASFPDCFCNAYMSSVAC